MKKLFFIVILLAGFVFSSELFAHGKLVNINLSGGGAYPLGSELTKVTAETPDQCGAELCNPAFFGAGGGAGLDFQLPYHIGIGLNFMFHSFLRKEDPSGNNAESKPFNDLKLLLGFSLRILDMVPSYNKKWGTLIIGAYSGVGWLYTEMHVPVKVELAYLYPVYNKDKFTVQIGLGGGFIYQHPFAGELSDDMMVDFGLKISIGILEEPWGSRKKKPGDIEAEMGETVSEEMKKQDSDGDGLNDYCELMLGTDTKNKDSDDDGLFDSEEDKNKNCMRDEGETDPAVADTDGGGAPDGWEVKADYDPQNPDDDDKDQDFITDHEDSCLNTPRGIAVNERGCPTLVEATVLEGVTFEGKTSDLTSEGQNALDDWVAVLQDNPELKFEIVGYTDNKGKKKKLITLTTKRAKVVFDYFSSKGISESRMSYKGKGAANPIESNKTKAGRDANNRIEIVPIFE